MPDRMQVVFVSRRGSLRAALAEGCLAQVARQRFGIFSCGDPDAMQMQTHPVASRALQLAGISQPSSIPRGWDVFRRLGARIAHFVIVLDEDAYTAMPGWPGHPATALWAYPDIAAAGLSERQQLDAATQMLHSLRRRLEIFTNLPMRGTDRAALGADLRDLATL